MAANTENAQDNVRELRCRVLVAGVGGGAGNVLGHALAEWNEPWPTPCCTRE